MFKSIQSQSRGPTALKESGPIDRIICGLIKLGLAAYGLIIICVIISNLSLFDPNWPFSLIASFSESLILILPVVLLCGLWKWRMAIFPIAALAIGAFYPVLAFDKFIQPSEQTCISGECVSIVAANLRHDPDALVRLAETEAKSADIIALVEVPHAATTEDLLALFSMNGKAEVAYLSDPNAQLGSRLAVITRLALNSVTLELENFAQSEKRQRGILRLSYPMKSGNLLDIVIVHPPPPKGAAETQSRDKYLQSASMPLFQQPNFVLIGDFNLTPWESGFDELPGNRAGDPRWSRTWNARKFWQRIAIDHALIGDGLHLREAGVLRDIGSDHFPIRVVVDAKEPQRGVN